MPPQMDRIILPALFMNIANYGAVGTGHSAITICIVVDTAHPFLGILSFMP